MKKARAQARSLQGSKKTDHKTEATTINPVQAAILEFVGEKLQLPMTPALIYGYFCAKRMGFEGNVAEFLTEVIDDFFQARGINYYQEVTQWGVIGKKTIQEEMKAPPQENPLQTGIAAK